jgi:hypothetical protein
MERLRILLGSQLPSLDRYQEEIVGLTEVPRSIVTYKGWFAAIRALCSNAGNVSGGKERKMPVTVVIFNCFKDGPKELFPSLSIFTLR